MITESGTTGLGWCTWYSGMRLQLQPLGAARPRCRTTGGNGATGKILLATTTSPRSSPERLAEDPLAAAEAVDLGGVEERDAQLAGAADDVARPRPAA